MAVDTAAIGTLYTALETNMIGTLDAFFDNYDIDATQKATVMAQGLTTILSLSVQTVMNEPIQTEQKKMITEQILTEKEKTKQVTRQTTAYDDQLRIKEAELLTNVVGMMGAGGATFSTADAGGKTVLTEMYNKLDAITPV